VEITRGGPRHRIDRQVYGQRIGVQAPGGRRQEGDDIRSGKKADATIVMGVNETTYDASKHNMFP